MKKKVISIIAALVLVIVLVIGVFLIWFLRPMSLYHVLEDAEILLVGRSFYTEDNGVPAFDHKNDTLKPEDEQFTEVMSILKKYEYRHCMESLLPGAKVDISDYGIHLSDGNCAIVLNGVSKIIVEGKVYVLCGKESASAIMEEFKEVFGD